VSLDERRARVVATTEAEMTKGPEVQYRNWATPDATLDLLAALQAGRGISAGSRERLLRWMTESVPGPGRLKGELPAGAAVAHKTGTSGPMTC
jgi:beta-lactamase class A